MGIAVLWAENERKERSAYDKSYCTFDFSSYFGYFSFLHKKSQEKRCEVYWLSCLWKLSQRKENEKKTGQGPDVSQIVLKGRGKQLRYNYNTKSQQEKEMGIFYLLTFLIRSHICLL